LNMKAIHFRVFNRLGNIVYESHDIYNGWDGFYNNKLQEAGTYVWYLQYIGMDNVLKYLKGTSILIR